MAGHELCFPLLCVGNPVQNGLVYGKHDSTHLFVTAKSQSFRLSFPAHRSSHSSTERVPLSCESHLKSSHHPPKPGHILSFLLLNSWHGATSISCTFKLSSDKNGLPKLCQLTHQKFLSNIITDCNSLNKLIAYMFHFERIGRTWVAIFDQFHQTILKSVKIFFWLLRSRPKLKFLIFLCLARIKSSNQLCREFFKR